MKSKWQVVPDRLSRVPEMVNSTLDAMNDKVAQLCQLYRYMDHAVVVGRGLSYSNAFEFALKTNRDLLRRRRTIFPRRFNAWSNRK